MLPLTKKELKPNEDEKILYLWKMNPKKMLKI